MKNKRLVKCLALCLALLQLLLLCAACGGDENKTTAASTTEEKPAGTTAGKPDNNATTAPKEDATTPGDDDPDSPYLYLVVDGEAQYVLVNPLSATTEAKEISKSFATDLQELTGATFRSITESYVPESDREILLCARVNRPAAQELFRNIGYTEYAIALDGDRIMCATFGTYLEKMTEYILENLYELEEGTWVIDRDMMEFSRDLYNTRKIPQYETELGVVADNNIYMSNPEGYTVAIWKTNPTELAAYLTKLEGLGYTEYTRSSLGLVDFYTYTKANQTLHVQLKKGVERLKADEVRITLTKNEYLPSTEKPTYETLVDSKVIQPYIYGNPALTSGIAGYAMGIYFQLADGSFILADGGLYVTSERNALIKMIKDNTPAGKTPTVALWLWSHAHGDHVDMCRKAIVDFKQAGIDIKGYAHNFPDWKVVGKDVGDASVYSDDMVSDMKLMYPNAVEWVAHAGQTMYIANAEITCWWTHEDVYPLGFYTLNDTGSVFSVSIDGVRTMILGDCQNPNEKMISQYKEAMESPLVQNSHHSGNGPKKMYEYIDPIWSFWACSDELKAERQEKLDHCIWLTTTKWTRTDADGNEVTGTRMHYTNSKQDILLIKDIKAQLSGWLGE